jgi:DNA-binding transcriptional LysR family regulator
MSSERVADSLEPRLLRVLVALAEEGSFTDAAVRLGTGQPAVSRALARLEVVLGVRLVERTTRSVRLTVAGRSCYPAAVEALAGLEVVADAAQGRGRPLRLGYAWAALGPYTSAILRAWRAQHPEVTLEVHRVDERSAGLRTGAVDVAVRRDAVVDPGVHVEPIFTEGRLAAVPAGSELAGRPSLTLADLADQVVALSPAAGTTTLDLWPATARPTQVVEVTNTDEWLLAIAVGGAVGVTPASTATQHAHPGVRFVPLTAVPDVTVALVWPERGPHPAVPAFAALVRACVDDPGALSPP